MPLRQERDIFLGEDFWKRQRAKDGKKEESDESQDKEMHREMGCNSTAANKKTQHVQRKRKNRQL